MNEGIHVFAWTEALNRRHAELEELFLTSQMNDEQWVFMKLLERLGDQSCALPQITENELVEYCRGAIEREGSAFNESHWRVLAGKAIEVCETL